MSRGTRTPNLVIWPLQIRKDVALSAAASLSCRLLSDGPCRILNCAGLARSLAMHHKCRCGVARAAVLAGRAW
jgi:hypothetical protein